MSGAATEPPAGAAGGGFCLAGCSPMLCALPGRGRVGAVLPHEESALALARAAALLARGLPAEAGQEARRCLELCDRGLAPAHHRPLEAGTLLGRALAGMELREEAIGRLESTREAWRTHFGEHHHGTTEARLALEALVGGG